MRIVIIEDEGLTATDLAETICKVQADAEIVAVLGSIRESISFLRTAHDIDLVFSDIQLGDGLSFEIFSSTVVNAPVIFCTAYDEYALDAFKARGIDYILKPFTDETVRNALHKFMDLKKTLAPKEVQYGEIVRMFNSRRPLEGGSILIHQKDKILPIIISSIAFLHLKNAIVHVTTFDNKTYLLSKNLEEMEKVTGPTFFRVNRQYLVNRKAVVDASSYLTRKVSIKLSVPVPEIIMVSKEKLSSFMTWLEQP